MKTKTLLLGLVFLMVPFVSRAAMHTAGTNVLSNGTVFMVTTDAQLRPYTSAGAFLSYGFNSFGSVVPASADDLQLPTGNFIPPRDGGITCSDRGTDKGTCYLITNGQKAGFTSSEVFKKLGFSFNHVVTGDVSFLPSTSNITETTEAHLPGTLINDNGTVKLIGTNGAVGVPSEDTLKSWGYSLADVVPATTADKTIPQTEVLLPHAVGELVPKIPPFPIPCPDNATTCTPLPRPCAISTSGTICPLPTPIPQPCITTTGTACPIPPIPCTSTTTTVNCEPIPPPIPIPCDITNTTSTTCIPTPMPPPTPIPCISPLMPVNCVPVPVPTPNPSPVIITSLTPAFGPVGTPVTIVGSGFTPTGNYILFGLGALSAYSSADGKTLQFTVPSSLGASCTTGTACPLLSQQVTPGAYNVRVANYSGMSDALAFTVVATATTPAPLPPTSSLGALIATVRANATIDLKKAEVLVTSLQPGAYTIYVADQSSMHNFHLTGPGVDLKTTVDGVSNTSWNVNLTAGTYTYVCDPHSTNMRGSFTVAN